MDSGEAAVLSSTLVGVDSVAKLLLEVVAQTRPPEQRHREWLHAACKFGRQQHESSLECLDEHSPQATSEAPTKCGRRSLLRLESSGETWRRAGRSNERY